MKTRRFIGFAVLIAAAGMVMAGCDNAMEGGGTPAVITLTNLPEEISGDVLVLLFGAGYYPAGAEGSVSDRSVTVPLLRFTGNPEDRLGGGPWINDGRAYRIGIGYDGAHFSHPSWWESPNYRVLPGNGVIDTYASGFVFGNGHPTTTPTGHITGTLELTGIVPDVTRMYLGAYGLSSSPYWDSWYIGINHSVISGGSLTRAFDIRLYDGAENSGPFTPGAVGFNAIISYDDGTEWRAYIDNAGSGWTIPDQTSTTEVGTVSAALPATTVISGTANVTIQGKTVESVYVSLTLSSGGTGNSFVATLSGGAWKIRVPAAATDGTFSINARASDGTSYGKSGVGTWSGSVSDNAITVTLTESNRQS